MKNMKVAITGGAGFIGSNLANVLAKDNDVIIIDDLSSGRISNISKLSHNSSFSFIQSTILNLSELKQSLANVDYVFHLAAITSVPISLKDPLKVNEVNITGTLNVLLAAQHCRAKKVVFASSSSIYGSAQKSAGKETCFPRPESPYALSKLTGEYYCDMFRNLFGLPTVSLRYFNVYGPNQDPGSTYAAVIPKFITQVLNGEVLSIYGDGNQTRDFIYVQDVVDATIKAAECDCHGVLNIGTGHQVTISELTSIIMSIVGKPVQVAYLSPRIGDIPYSKANVSKAQASGIRSKRTLEEGLRETVTHIMSSYPRS